MNWQEILTILIPLFGLMGWVYSRIEKKSMERYLDLKNDIKDLKLEINDVKKEISSIKDRLSTLEGKFDERGRWEARISLEDSKKSSSASSS